ncbi:hypothetical protein GGI12_005392 [Dipsacomyces acuminosporus]|nr:hypothetical protein GGI12_005392 [Dipsacomyces acuminosporus]
MHKLVNPRAPICRNFAHKGFCAKGDKCLHRHVWECPDWIEKGKCAKVKCKLPHPPRKDKADISCYNETMTREEEEEFQRNYIQRPIFDQKTGKPIANDAAAAASLASGSMSESESGSDNDSLSEGLSGDEADELLKWYDDNYTDK